MNHLEEVIEIKRCMIENAPEELGVEAIVNAAKPSLMGGEKGSVDYAVHEKMNAQYGIPNGLKKRLQWEIDGNWDGPEDAIRCQRGKFYLSREACVCKYIFHTVGTQNDAEETDKKRCSSSRLSALESCYSGIIAEVMKMPDITKIAFPVIGTGNYKMDFETALRIGIAAVYNTLLEKYKEDEEYFRYVKLEKVYFLVPSDIKAVQAETILEEYRKVFCEKHRAVAQKAADSQRSLIREIKLYDERKGHFSLVKRVRLYLSYLRLYIFPISYLRKDKRGGYDWDKRRKIVENFVLFKMLMLIVGAGILSFFDLGRAVRYGVAAVSAYMLADTVTYLFSLIILADIQKPSANIIRSLLLLAVNYVEAGIELSLIRSMVYYEKNMKLAVLGFNFFGGKSPVPAGSAPLILTVLNDFVRFFFLSLAFGYFINHLRQRRFRR